MEKIIDESKQGQPLALDQNKENQRKLFIESYGCQMNFSDSEIVASILAKEGFNTTQNLEDADLVLVNTCSIREKAEQTVRKRLEKYNAVKRINPGMKVGVLGCMAERLKSKFLEEEKIVDLVVGPDAYKDLPNLIEKVDAGAAGFQLVDRQDGELRYETILENFADNVATLDFDQLNVMDETLWGTLRATIMLELETFAGDTYRLTFAESDAEEVYLRVSSDTVSDLWSSWLFEVSSYAKSQLDKSYADFLVEVDDTESSVVED